MKAQLTRALLIKMIVAYVSTAAYAQKSVQPLKISRKASPLEVAYKLRSQEKLTQFFQDWSQSIPAISDRELVTLSKQQQEAYKVFTAFYKPHRLDSLGGSEWGNSIYQNVNFLLVQNSVKIHTVAKIFYSDTDIDSIITGVITRTVKEDSTRQRRLKKVDGKLNQQVREEFGFENSFSFHSTENPEAIGEDLIDFRPVVKAPGKQVIFLTPDKEKTLKAFLGDKHLPVGAGGIMNPAHSSGESEKRMTFLENSIKIWYGHWGGYWQLNSYPVAYSITFDKSMLYARVSFRMVYEGGEAILKRTNGKWALLSSKRTWIE